MVMLTVEVSTTKSSIIKDSTKDIQESLKLTLKLHFIQLFQSTWTRINQNAWIAKNIQFILVRIFVLEEVDKQHPNLNQEICSFYFFKTSTGEATIRALNFKKHQPDDSQRSRHTFEFINSSF